MPKKFRGPQFPLSRSRYGQTVRDAQSSKLNRLRSKEKTVGSISANQVPASFTAAINSAMTKKRK